MAIYYLSACHECKEKVMWSKVSEEQAKKWHETFHKEHKTAFGNDLDDDFYESIWKYDDLGIQDGVDE
jgi:hypothetical protein